MRRFVALVAVLAAVAVASAAAVHASQPGWWLRLWYPLDHTATINGYAKKYRLDPALVAAVIYKESRFKADARSSAGAIGAVAHDAGIGVARLAARGIGWAIKLRHVPGAQARHQLPGRNAGRQEFDIGHHRLHFRRAHR